jgi:hypothetical protein
LEVAGVSYGGGILWRFSGADIFTNGFELSHHHVDVIDWNDNRYRIDLATGKGNTLAI